MSDVKVTVCVPTVDRLSFLAESLLSVVEQSCRDWELVIGENSGDSAYAECVDRLVESLTSRVRNSVRVLHQGSKLSIVEHANRLIGAARGDYVLYLPDDDKLRTDCLERMMAPIAVDPSVDLVFSDHWVIRSDGSTDVAATEVNTVRYGRADLLRGRVAERDLIALALRQSCTLQAMLVKRTVLGREPFKQEMELLPDVDLLLRLAERKPPLHVVFCPERLVEYRIHDAQVSTKRRPADERAQFHLAFLASLTSCESVPPEHIRLYRRKIAQQRAGLAFCYGSSHDWPAWWSTSIAAIRDDPGWARGYLPLLRPFVPRRLESLLRSAWAASGRSVARLLPLARITP